MGVEVTERGERGEKKSEVSCDEEYQTLNTIGHLVNTEWNKKYEQGQSS